eukprot:s11666_g1.t1
MSGARKSERLLLGPYPAGSQKFGDVCCEAYTTLIGKVIALYRSIRNELFNPDLSPADRALQVADSLDVPGEEPGVMRGPRDDGDAEPAAASEGETDESASHGDDDAPF